MREKAVMAVFVAKSGLVHHRVLDVEFSSRRDELGRMSNYLRSLLGGKTLSEVRREILAAMADERLQADQIMRNALLLGERTLRPPAPRHAGAGREHLLRSPGVCGHREDADDPSGVRREDALASPPRSRRAPPDRRGGCVPTRRRWWRSASRARCGI